MQQHLVIAHTVTIWRKDLETLIRRMDLDNNIFLAQTSVLFVQKIRLKSVPLLGLAKARLTYFK